MRFSARSALFVGVLIGSVPAYSQSSPGTTPPDGAVLFRSQCATCHTLSAAEPARQGPNLEHVFGRKIGSVEGYAYTPGYKESTDTWGESNLDAYLTAPAKMFPGSTMSYRQSKPEVRQAIIAYLKERG